MRQHRQEFVLLAIGVAKRLLSLLLIVDIGAGAEPSADLALLVAKRCAPRLEPAVYAVKSAHAVLQVVAILSGDGPLPAGQRTLLIVRVNHQLQPLQPQLLGFGNTRVLDPLPAQVIALSIGPGGPEELLHAIGERAETLLAVANLGCLPLVLGDEPAHLVLPPPVAYGALHGRHQRGNIDGALHQGHVAGAEQAIDPFRGLVGGSREDDQRHVGPGRLAAQKDGEGREAAPEYGLRSDDGCSGSARGFLAQLVHARAWA